MKKQESLASKLFDVCNILFMIVLIMVMAYPMVYVFSASISNNAMVASGAVLLWPKRLR